LLDFIHELYYDARIHEHHEEYVRTKCLFVLSDRIHQKAVVMLRFVGNSGIFVRTTEEQHDKPQPGKSVFESQFEYDNSGYEPEG